LRTGKGFTGTSSVNDTSDTFITGVVDTAEACITGISDTGKVSDLYLFITGQYQQHQ
jgi:hypothetical protein